MIFPPPDLDEWRRYAEHIEACGALFAASIEVHHLGVHCAKWTWRKLMALLKKDVEEGVKSLEEALTFDNSPYHVTVNYDTSAYGMVVKE